MTGPAEILHGPMLIGTMINILLYGIMIAQVYIYYTTYRRDRIFVKTYVFALLLIDGINTAFDIAFIYLCLIPHFGDVKYLAIANWTAEICDAPASTGVITLMVQLFYAWRIHVLTKNWFLVAFVALLSVTSAVFAMLSTWESVVKYPEITSLPKIKPVAIVWLTCAAVADIVITAILRKHRSGFQRTDMMINRVIRVTMQTGLVTSVVATVDLILFLSSPSGAHMAFSLILCKLYSNSLLCSLNSRGGWKFGADVTTQCSINEFHCESQPSNGQVGVTTSQPSTIKLEASLDSVKIPKTGVLVHVASRQVQEVVLPENDPKV